jgi:ketosteroid isomerase-like protein
MAHPNEELLRRVDAQMAKGNPQAMFDLFADDAVVHVGGRSKMAGDYKGKGEIQQSFGLFMQSLGDNPSLESHDIVANDTHGIVMQTAKGARGGKSIEIKGLGIMHFSGGKVTEAWFLDEDPYTADPWYDAGLP